MTDFASLFPNAEMMQTLGDDVVYIGKGGTSAAIKAMVNYGSRQTYATDSYVPEYSVTIDVLKADAPNLAKGDKFVHNGRTLVCDVLINDDGHFVSWAVR